MERRCVADGAIPAINATNLSTVFIASDRSKYRSNVIPLGSKTTQAVLNPSGQRLARRFPLLCFTIEQATQIDFERVDAVHQNICSL